MDLFLSFFANIDWSDIWEATGDTMMMLGGSLLFTVLLGLPLGVLLFLCSPRQLSSTSRPIRRCRSWSTWCVRCRSSSC